MFQLFCPRLNANVQGPAIIIRNSSWYRGRVRAIIWKKIVSDCYVLCTHCARGIEVYLDHLYGMFFKLNIPATKMLPKSMCTI